MPILALVSGELYRAPESKISKAGKPFVTATVRSKDTEVSTYIRVVAFSESVQAELMRLRDGDSVSVQGPLKAEVYMPREVGEPRVSLSIIANNVLALRQPKERKHLDTSLLGRLRSMTGLVVYFEAPPR